MKIVLEGPHFLDFCESRLFCGSIRKVVLKNKKVIENVALDSLVWGGQGGLTPGYGIETIAPDTLVRLGYVGLM